MTLKKTNVKQSETNTGSAKENLIKRFWKDWSVTIFILFFILLVSFVLRYLKVIVGQQPVFADEAIYVRWSQVMKAEPTLRFLPLSDGKQPLYMWILMFLLRGGFDPLIVGRLLSVFFGVMTNLGVFVLSYILFRSKKVGIVAAILYAVSPFAMFFESMALVDSTLAMMGVWFIIFLYLAFKTSRLDLSMISGFFLGGALLTKSPALYFTLLTPVVAAVVSFSKKWKKALFEFSKKILLIIPIFTIGYGMYNILRLGPNFHLIGARNTDYVFPISHLWQNPKDPFIFHIEEIGQWLWMLGPGVLLFLLILGLIVGFKKYRRETCVLSLWILLPILANAMYAKVFTARYILFAMPFIYIISALFILFRSKLQKLTYLLLTLFVANSLLVNYLLIWKIEEAPLPKSERTGYLEEWTAGYGIKEVSQYLINELDKTPSDKKIVVGTEGYFGTLPDGLQIYLNSYPEITVIGVGLDLKEVPISLIESKDAGNKTYLVINSSRLVAKPDDLNLLLIRSYPKPLRSKGTHDFVKYGPQETLYFFEVL